MNINILFGRAELAKGKMTKGDGATFCFSFFSKAQSGLLPRPSCLGLISSSQGGTAVLEARGTSGSPSQALLLLKAGSLILEPGQSGERLHLDHGTHLHALALT